MTPKLISKLQCKSISRWLGPARMLAATACAVLLFSALAPFAIAQTPTLIVVRALPAKLKKGETAQALPPLTKTDVGEIKLGGKTVEMTDFQPVLKGPHVLQLMVILDSEEMLGAAGQFDEIKKFFADMPPNVEIGVGWLLQGNVKVVQPFTTDRDLAGKALIAKAREEAANPKNDNGNPYQCLRNLAAHWPDGDPGKLRAVLMFTDGITRGNGQAQANDQLNPDVAGLPVAGAGRDRSLPVLLDGPHRCGPKPGPRGTARGTNQLLSTGRGHWWRSALRGYFRPRLADSSA
jgi:hypothetical protein